MRAIALATKAWRFGAGVICMRRDDIILASYPKSGNTWLRFILCNLISADEWGGREVDFPTLDATMPELGVSKLCRSWEFGGTIPRFIKTHHRYGPWFSGARAIWLVRNPVDVMWSYYRFAKSNMRIRYDGDFSEFIRDRHFGIASWTRNYESWRDNAGLIIQYEWLKDDAVRVAKKVLDFAGVKKADAMVEQAVLRAQSGNVQRLQRKYGHTNPGNFTTNYQFAGSGTDRRAGEEFLDEDRALIKDHVAAAGIQRYEI